MKVQKSIVIWALWVAAVLFFAFAMRAAPGDAGEFPTGPEFFLFALGMFHLVLGGVLLVTTFLEDNEL